jgi:crotonobetainyl-CoA:carnitine CoA-transferase CaiB-like acyl-CoA transferase
MGNMKLVGNAVDMSHAPPGIDRPPPMLGEHTEEVLASLGYANGEITSLREKGVI